MILVYAPQASMRIEYTAGLLLGGLLGSDWSLTAETEEYLNFKGPRINYSKQPLSEDEVHIVAHGFLNEQGIKEFFPGMNRSNDLPLLFPSSGPLGFDPFSASFYLVSRYEEYLPHTKDIHGRFEATESYAHKNNFLQRPVVNHYAILLGDLLQERFPGYRYALPGFTYIPTYDIDIAYAYRGRGIVRTLFGGLRSLFRLEPDAIRQRILVLTGKQDDPFDTYDEMIGLYKQYGIKAFCFVLCGDYGPYDKNLPVYSGVFSSLVKKLADYANVGLHPSYASHGDPRMLAREVVRLAGIIQQDVRFSRQHYLRLSLPHTYRRLIELNITHDFSMGYASQPGFRAGICSPFRFYDLETESITPLTIVPFALMDGSFRDYLKMDPSDSLPLISHLIEEVDRVQGTFVSLWHNHSLGTGYGQQGWKNVYEQMFALAASKHKIDYDPFPDA